MKNLIAFLIVILSFLMIVSCKKETVTTQVVIPTVTTLDSVSIAQVTAISGGNIPYEGGRSVTDRGVCWSSLHTPTIKDSLTHDGNGSGMFISYLFNLKLNHTYRLRAYATNSGGTAYGQEITFTTLNTGNLVFNPFCTYGTLTDIDGNTYKTIQIGTQLWMAENLKTLRFCNGDLVGTTTPANSADNFQLGASYQWSFKGNENNVIEYGRLYTWYAANDDRKICPVGWHVPTDTEWSTLSTYLGGENFAGGLLKEAGLLHWLAPNTGATNQSGFTALPAGIRPVNGKFDFAGYICIFWSSTIKDSWAWSRELDLQAHKMFRAEDVKEYGFSIRCISDN